jgi:hypothetical protein
MMTIAAMAADALGKLLAKDFKRLFGSSHKEYAERLDELCGNLGEGAVRRRAGLTSV